MWSRCDGKPDQFRLRQIPEISGAIVAMDPYTGRVHAMVGGFSFDQSEFNRANQAMRQPGSSFKPIVYATALDKGYTPSSQVLDAPFVLDMGPGQAAWAPTNYDGKSAGLRTLRYGVEHSKNLMTVRLANEVGMPVDLGICPPIRRLRRSAAIVVDVARRRRDDRDAHDRGLFDVREWRPAHQADAHRPHPGSHRQDHLPPRRPQMRRLRRGRVGRRSRAQADGQPRAGDRSADRLPDDLDPRGRRAARHAQSVKVVGKPLAGKTGTTNDAKDVWFVGFSPDLAVGVFIGYDKPASLGNAATAGQYAAPVFRDFMQMALKDKPATPFRVPARHQADPRQRLDGPAGRIGRGRRRDRRGVQARHRRRRRAISRSRWSRQAEAAARGAARRGAGKRRRVVLSRIRRPYDESAQRGARFTRRGADRMTRAPPDETLSNTMRAEIEHLVDETKQSIGLLRRHL